MNQSESCIRILRYYLWESWNKNWLQISVLVYEQLRDRIDDYGCSVHIQLSNLVSVYALDCTRIFFLAFKKESSNASSAEIDHLIGCEHP